MDGLKLSMRESRFDQDRRALWSIVEESLQCSHRRLDLLARRRYVTRGGRAGSANPVLLLTEPPRRLVLPPSAAEKDAVDLSEKAIADREALLEKLETSVHGGDVVGRFLRVTQRHARSRDPGAAR